MRFCRKTCLVSLQGARQRLAERQLTGRLSSARTAIILTDFARVHKIAGDAPKTRSGKILRGTVKRIAARKPWTMPATIEDPKVLDEIGSALKDKGVGAS